VKPATRLQHSDYMKYLVLFVNTLGRLRCVRLCRPCRSSPLPSMRVSAFSQIPTAIVLRIGEESWLTGGKLVAPYVLVPMPFEQLSRQ